ncbi:unnamed protein product [Polarella glacialis]|uniref:Amine oxidase n=1 Tax=Polarella glacialis TaxID=89957 RepID=A0A813H550_POLGL|nr:unnamed protein product [Polarella glacialis]CAE8644655.1 unnamed protein product [Polarella glacialis]
MRVGVVGAGVSGLVCGTRLSALLRGANIPIKATVLEWGRGPGGRTARCRVNVEGVGEVSFDHAAPFFTATTAQFRQEVLLDWEARSLVFRWAGQGETCRKALEEQGQLWVGVPSNHAVCQGLVAELKASGAEHLYGRRVMSARFVGNTWRVTAVNRMTHPPRRHSSSMRSFCLTSFW